MRWEKWAENRIFRDIRTTVIHISTFSDPFHFLLTRPPGELHRDVHRGDQARASHRQHKREMQCRSETNLCECRRTDNSTFVIRRLLLLSFFSSRCAVTISRGRVLTSSKWWVRANSRANASGISPQARASIQAPMWVDVKQLTDEVFETFRFSL